MFYKESLNDMISIVNENGFDGMTEIFQLLLNHAMEVQRSQALQAKPYERSESRLGYANGFKPKRVQTRMGPVDLQIPQVRGEVDFYPSALDKGLRSERALKATLAEMYIQGVSTRKVTAVMKELCGFEVTSMQVSRATQTLDESFKEWRERPIGVCTYLSVDARYEKVRIGGQVLDASVLIAIGVKSDGKRCVLGVDVSLSEAEVHWRNFLESLVQRGLRGVQLITSDDHLGLKAARKAVFRGIPWQRCQFHLQQNAQHYITKDSLKKEIAAKIRRMFNSKTREEAEQKLKEMVVEYEKSQPKLSAWAEENLPEGFTVFELSESHRVRLRTSNSLERLNQEIKRRTRKVRIFPNEASLLRLVSAILVEKDEEWITESKPYLTFSNQ